MTYRVYSSPSGRGGTVYYVENEKEITFDWEFSMTGATIFVPTSDQWEAFCDSREFEMGKPRRLEILERIGAEICRQQTSRGKFEISGGFLEIRF